VQNAVASAASVASSPAPLFAPDLISTLNGVDDAAAILKVKLYNLV
jgi:hypothetical protein